MFNLFNYLIQRYQIFETFLGYRFCSDDTMEEKNFLALDSNLFQIMSHI